VRAPLVSALAATAVLATAGATASAPSPAEQQLAWVIQTLNGTTAPSAAVLRQHFTPSFLKAVPPAKVIDGLVSIAPGGPFRVTAILARHGTQGLQARVEGEKGASIRVSIHVAADRGHRIDGLLFEPIAPEIKTWQGVDAQLRKLASSASLYAGTGGGTAIHGFHASRAGAIGSAFKLYVLGALADAVEARTASWTEELAIHGDWKSLPSGDMRNAPDGKRFTLRHYAGQMISVSDNTAADHLIHRLGRDAVEAELGLLGNSVAARNEPFLTTRELFALKLVAPTALRTEFAAAGPAGRRSLLPRVDALGLRSALTAPWAKPIDIDTIEWFASPRDLAHAIAPLARDSATVRSILAINPGVQLDPKTWSYVGYKGGSEIGVLSFTWYLVRHDGKAFTLSIVLNDGRHDIDLTTAVGVAQAAVGLLAKSG
jgi:beta-lactamase class A